jgi:hypothetical protein
VPAVVQSGHAIVDRDAGKPAVDLVVTPDDEGERHPRGAHGGEHGDRLAERAGDVPGERHGRRDPRRRRDERQERAPPVVREREDHDEEQEDEEALRGRLRGDDEEARDRREIERGDECERRMLLAALESPQEHVVDGDRQKDGERGRRALRAKPHPGHSTQPRHPTQSNREGDRLRIDGRGGERSPLRGLRDLGRRRRRGAWLGHKAEARSAA